jgi:phospholipase C
MPWRKIQHVFVLMLENRSFDHMLGFSTIGGFNPTGRPRLNGLVDATGNLRKDIPVDVRVRSGERDPMVVDPGHEFKNVRTQLCGNAVYRRGGPYPAIDNSGFVSDFENMPKFTRLRDSELPEEDTPFPDDAMRCFPAGKLEVLSKLAESFAVCDSWFSSMPGPTWPNRFFAVAGTSGGLDHTPNGLSLGLNETLLGFGFRHGHIFQRLSKWRVYGGLCPFAQGLEGMHVRDPRIRPLGMFPEDVRREDYDVDFTWIEPNYGNFFNFRGGNSQHPLSGYAAGELLIKTVYEAIRKSE